MKMLALEFSSSRRSVAVGDAPGDAPNRGGSAGVASEQGEVRTRPFALVDRALEAAQCAREAIEGVAVGLGPGSYTGIRLAITLAEGWRLARAVAVWGVSSVECLAAQLQAAGRVGEVTLAIDGQRGEFYLARYRLAPGNREALETLHLAGRAEVERRLANGERLAGPDAPQWFPRAEAIYPDASMVARLAALRPPSAAGGLEPIYLRPSAFVKAPPPRFPPPEPA